MADTAALSLFALPGSPDLSGPTSQGRLVTGKEKLAERVLLELLTSKESLRFLPRRGSEFLDLAGSGRALSELDAFAAFSMAAQTVITNLRSEEQTTDLDSTRIAGARLTHLAVGDDGVAATVVVTSRAGTSEVSTVYLDAPVPDSRATFFPD